MPKASPAANKALVKSEVTSSITSSVASFNAESTNSLLLYFANWFWKNCFPLTIKLVACLGVVTDHFVKFSFTSCAKSLTAFLVGFWSKYVPLNKKFLK